MNEIQEFAICSDEDGEDYVSVLALVFDDKVELSPFVVEGDTETSVENRVSAFVDRFGSTPSEEKYVGIVHLYRTGEARLSLERCTSDAYGQRAQKLALQASEDLYDLAWPDVGKLCRQFVDSTVGDINSLKSAFPTSRVQEALASGAIEPWLQSTSTGDLLRKVLFEEEKVLLATGEITQKIGFVREGAAPIMAVRVPYEKYRWGRAVAEIARRLNALKIIHITSGFLLDTKTGKRTALEVLWGLVISPDGSIEASVRGVYQRENGRYRLKEGIRVVDPTSEEQYLIPGWCKAVQAVPPKLGEVGDVTDARPRRVEIP